MSAPNAIPAVCLHLARNGACANATALGLRPMREPAFEKRGRQSLRIKPFAASRTTPNGLRSCSSCTSK